MTINKRQSVYGQGRGRCFEQYRGFPKTLNTERGPYADAGVEYMIQIVLRICPANSQTKMHISEQ